MTDIDITAAIRPTSDAIYRQLSGQYGDFSTPSDEEAEAVLKAALPHILAQVEARVKPTREDVARTLDNELGPFLSYNPERFWGQPADAVLALWPGKTEAEVRKQLAEEHGIGDATSRPLYDAQVEIGRLQGLVSHLRTRERELEDQIARGGELG